MAEYQQQQQPPRPSEGIKGIVPEKGSPTSQILAIFVLLPIGGTLLLLAGLTLAGTLLGLAVSTPLFVIFSPVLVPAAIVIGLAVTGFLASGAFGITALSSLSWMANYISQLRSSWPQQVELAKLRVQETTGHVGQKAREMGQTAPKTQEVTRGL